MLLHALAARGIPAVGVDLLSCNAPANTVDVHDDIAQVCHVIDGVDGPSCSRASPTQERSSPALTIRASLISRISPR